MTGAAVAAVTDRIAVRAGSVVAPLHHILRIAEEWAVVDLLSGGRAGISLASGWRLADFVLRPGARDDRRAATEAAFDELRRLWRGEAITVPSEDGPVEVRSHPLPAAGPLPMWLSTGGSPESFAAAAAVGAGILTHLAEQTVEDLTERIRGYRAAWSAAGHPGRGHVTLMLHTYLHDDPAHLDAVVRPALEEYLLAALDLFRPDGGTTRGRAARARLAVRPAVDRILAEGLVCSPAEAVVRGQRYHALGVDEIACLVDLGVPRPAAFAALDPLAEVVTTLAPVAVSEPIP